MSIELKDIYAPLPNTTRGQPVKLGGDPKGKNFVYASGSNIVIRDIANPFIADIYTEHVKTTSVAKYSPSGFYIASGDSTGRVKIWDTQNKEHILKFELQCFAGQVRDICWTGDNKRIIAVGSGKGVFAKAFMWDSGSNVGAIDKHVKEINAVDCRKDRPFRAVTASIDFSVNFYKGVPFKFEKKHKVHKRFVNDVRFSPNGETFVTVGSDKGIFLFEGKTGEAKGSLPVEHKAGINGVYWSPDGKHIMTSSGDKTVKIWDVEAQKSVTTHVLGTETKDQQYGCLWQGDYLLSVSLSGQINYIDRNNPKKPLRVLYGHNKAITAVTYNDKEKDFYTGSFDAVITKWNEEDGSNEGFTGNGHTNQIEDIHVQSTNLITASMDSTVRVTSLTTKQYHTSFKCDTDATGLAVGKKNKALLVASSLDGLIVIRSGVEASKQLRKQKLDYEAKCIALSADEKQIAVGGNDKKIHIYDIESGGDNFKEVKVLTDHSQPISALEYSSKGKLVSCAKGEIYVWDLDKGEKELFSNGWGSYHAATVPNVRWAPDAQHLATCSHDGSIRVWDINSRKKIVAKGAHKGGANDIVWISNEKLASVGADATLKSWDVKFG